MTNFKKLSLFFIICTIFSTIIGTEQQNQFVTDNTKDFEYFKTIEEISAPENSPDQQPTVIYDQTRDSSLFHNGTTHTRITKEIKNGRVITTTEKWVSKKYSYLIAANLTWLSIFLGASMLGYINYQGMAAVHAYQNEITRDAGNLFAHMFSHPLADAKKVYQENAFRYNVDGSARNNDIPLSSKELSAINMAAEKFAEQWKKMYEFAKE